MALEQGLQLLEMDNENRGNLDSFIERLTKRAVKDGRLHHGTVLLPNRRSFYLLRFPDDDVTAAENLTHVCSRRKHAQNADRQLGFWLTPTPARPRVGMRMSDP